MRADDPVHFVDDLDNVNFPVVWSAPGIRSLAIGSPYQGDVDISATVGRYGFSACRHPPIPWTNIGTEPTVWIWRKASATYVKKTPRLDRGSRACFMSVYGKPATCSESQRRRLCWHRLVRWIHRRRRDLACGTGRRVGAGEGKQDSKQSEPSPLHRMRLLRLGILHCRWRSAAIVGTGQLVPFTSIPRPRVT